MKVNIIDLENKDVGKISLNPSIFSVKYRPDILKDVIEWQLAKRRSGTHMTKGISGVSGTTAKPFQQKRTGRARQGSLRSPQFRGGGIIFGPVVRSHEISLNKKVRKLGIKVALSLKYSSNKLLVTDALNFKASKTSDMLKFVDKFNHSSFLIVSDYQNNTLLACRNLHNVNSLKPKGINVFDILRHDCIVLSSEAIKYLEDRLL